MKIFFFNRNIKTLVIRINKYNIKISSELVYNQKIKETLLTIKNSLFDFCITATYYLPTLQHFILIDNVRFDISDVSYNMLVDAAKIATAHNKFLNIKTTLEKIKLEIY